MNGLPEWLSRGRALLAVGALAVVAVGVWFVFAPARSNNANQRPPYVLPVTLAEVSGREVRSQLSLTGSVRAARGAALAFEVAGVVSSVTVQEADRVVEGQVIARRQ